MLLLNRLAAALLAALLALAPAMAADISAGSWSQTDGSNTASPPSGWPVGMLPSQVAATARAMMGAVKRWHDQISPTVTSGGAANVQTLTYTVAPTAYVTGDIYAFLAGFTNTGAATLNVNGLGAKSVLAAGTALTGGEMVAGEVVQVRYDGTDFVIMWPLASATSTAEAKILAAMAGAVGDGATDAADAIETALAANAATGAGCLMLPPPAVKYKIGRTITVPPNACLDGLAGMPTWLWLANGVNAPMFQTAPGAGNITFKNLQLDGNRANNTASQGILVVGHSGASRFVFDNVWLHDFYQDGLRAQDASQLYVLGGGYYNNGRAGVSLDDGLTQFIIQSMAWNNGTHGLGCIGGCTKGWISGVAWDNGQGDPVTGDTADNFTGYNSGVADLVVGPLVSVGGLNNGVHFGGSHVAYTGVDIKSPAFYGLFHSSTTVYSTGTITATHGSRTITGSGTLWSTLYPFGGFGARITIGADTYLIRKITSNTSLTIQGAGFVGSTASGLSYAMAGSVASSDVTITGGHVEAGSGTYAAVGMALVNGGSISGLSDSTTASTFGLILFGSSNISVANNNFSNKTTAGAEINSQVAAYGTGTVTTTNGSPTITGSGTSWLDNVAGTGSYFMAAGDTVAYSVSSVDSDTQITLATNYACVSCGAGKSYNTAAGLSQKLAFNGGTFNSNTGAGMRVRNTLNSGFTGYAANDNGVYGVQEAEIATGNFYAAASASGNLSAPAAIQPGSAVAVSCSVGTLNPTTAVITNGSITHC